MRLYTIGLALAPDRKTQVFRYTRHVVNPSKDRPHRAHCLGLTGSGALCLMHDKRWMRDLLRLVRASDAKRVSPLVVADHLARFNLFAHQNTADGTVGPRAIVAWRHNKSGVYRGGGGHQFYDGTVRERGADQLPTIANGMDIQALVTVTMPFMMPYLISQLNALHTGEEPSVLDVTRLDAEVAKLPTHPEEDLK
ncbi:hypothetical protein D3870_07270 [Noviherbaspirillum cavernae]|uniref:Uncharacterized protein n=1 Tax=Noviherbaspirillum cavernae TaxID=2320862 RepID=A0A418X0H4_9BURK|nr:hypothetical protein D3870_07270 [Noviherbaspirillum cavernae]